MNVYQLNYVIIEDKKPIMNAVMFADKKDLEDFNEFMADHIQPYHSWVVEGNFVQDEEGEA